MRFIAILVVLLSLVIVGAIGYVVYLAAQCMCVPENPYSWWDIGLAYLAVLVIALVGAYRRSE